MSDWDERMWNLILFKMPVTNETRDGVFLLYACLALAALIAWGLYKLWHLMF